MIFPLQQGFEFVFVTSGFLSAGWRGVDEVRAFFLYAARHRTYIFTGWVSVRWLTEVKFDSCQKESYY